MNTETNPEIEVPAAQQVAVQSALAPAEEPMLSLIDTIDRTARDPTVDPNKYKQLMDLVVQLQERQAEREFNIAMWEAQSAVVPVVSDAKNPSTSNSKYATLFALDAALRPIYSRYGLSVSFDTGDNALPDQVRVIAILRHTGGYVREFHIDMPADGKGPKGGDVMSKTHATGSAVSYGRRYLLLMIFNISVDRDDDGNAASTATINAKQIENLRNGIEQTGADLSRYCAYMKVKSIEEIPADKYKDAVAALKMKQKVKGKKS